MSEAFGAAGVLQSQSSITMNLRLPGQYYDQETDSHYNFHRDYRPNMGRYIQSDPIGTKGGVNLFVYVLQDPLWGSDAMGLHPDICGGTDCIDPPYDPTPDGPKPSPNETSKTDPAYEGWIDKCAEEFCSHIKGDGFGNRCRRKGCEKTIKWACRRAGTNYNCCDCVKLQCISSMAGKGMDEHTAYVYCQSNFLLCMGRGK